jgi:TolB-like protein/Tfp pilus assembly protein PilF
MQQQPNKLSQFWQELKRRNVTRVLAVYIAAGFMILELVDMISEPFGLPEWSFKLALFILFAGLFITLIISWIFDVTPKGVEKTKPSSELQEGEKTIASNSWKIATYVSFVVIIGLVVLNIVGGGKQLRAGDIQSLVILPFENNTGDDQLDNMVSSMHSLLCGDMGRISGLRVIGKTSSKTYKDTDMSAKDIARELNVDAVLEPTIMCLGDSVCMQFILVSTTGEEDQIWIADYREDKRQILNMFNRITRQVADEVKVELTPEEERLLSISKTVDREAYDAYLKGYQNDGSKESCYKALEYLNSAVEKDPDWAPLYSGLTSVWLTIAQMGYESPENVGPKIYENLNKALELDPNNAESHHFNAMIAYLTEWNWENSEMEFLKAIAINPNNAGSRVFYAHLLSILQRPGEALTQGRLAIELDPLNPMIQILYTAVLSYIGDFKTALAYGEKVTAVDPGHYLANSLIENTAFRCGDYNKVMEATKYVLAYTEVDFKEVERIFGETGFVAAYEEILRQLEVLAQKGYYPPVDMAIRYMMADQPDKAMEWIEKGFEAHDQNMPYIATKGYLCEPLFDNPRFIEILQKMNLPLPED